MGLVFFFAMHGIEKDKVFKGSLNEKYLHWRGNLAWKYRYQILVAFVASNLSAILNYNSHLILFLITLLSLIITVVSLSYLEIFWAPSINKVKLLPVQVLSMESCEPVSVKKESNRLSSVVKPWNFRDWHLGNTNFFSFDDKFLSCMTEVFLALQNEIFWELFDSVFANAKKIIFHVFDDLKMPLEDLIPS